MDLSLPKTISTRLWTGRSDSFSGMVSFLGLLLHALALPFKSQARLEAEIVFLRHQLNLLRRRLPAKPRLTAADRLLFIARCSFRQGQPLEDAILGGQIFVPRQQILVHRPRHVGQRRAQSISAPYPTLILGDGISDCPEQSTITRNCDLMSPTDWFSAVPVF